MRRSVDEVQVQSVRTLTGQYAFASKSNARRRRLAQIREEDSLPNGGARRGLHVLHVEDNLRKAFVENSRLNLERRLGSLELVLKVSERGQGPGRQKNAVAQCQQPSRGHENHD